MEKEYGSTLDGVILDAWRTSFDTVALVSDSWRQMYETQRDEAIYWKEKALFY
jgi:hypothetical protein